MSASPNAPSDSSVGKYPASVDVVWQLERILAHPLFQKSLRLSAILRFTVESALAGRGEEQLKERTIGVEALHLGPSYEPVENPVVRIMVGRLRGKLAEYYQDGGQLDRVVIDLPRGGYVPRFIWRDPPSAHQIITIAHSNSVGRQKEQNNLREAFAAVSNGIGLMITISGEAGIGKTTVVEDFLAEVERQTATAWVGRGRCSERLAETDALAPIFEVLDDLRHGQSGGHVIQTMKTTAPAWHRQFSPDMNEAGQPPTPENRNMSHERMRREFVYFLRELAETRPVILFLDDLHWADASTCDVLAYMGTRMRNIRILVLTTHRPVSIPINKHPFLPLKFDLEHRGLCRELALSFLRQSDIEAYVATEFPKNVFPKEFMKVVHDRTEGNPLFMADMLRFLRDRGIVTKQGESWLLTQPVMKVRKIIPDGIQNMIRLKIERFNQEDRRILLCAAVQGEQFDSAMIAQMLSRDPVDIEERLQQLETIHNFIRDVGGNRVPERHLLSAVSVRPCVLPERALCFVDTCSARISESRHRAGACEPCWR